VDYLRIPYIYSLRDAWFSLAKNFLLMSCCDFLEPKIMQLILIQVCGRIPTCTPSWCNDFVDGPIIPFVFCFLGIAFWFRVCRIVTPVIENSRVVQFIANNTFSIMINQFAGFFIVNMIYALIHKYTEAFSNFNVESFKTDIWYRYLPGGFNQMNIIYLVAGIAIPILIQESINLIHKRINKIIAGR